MNNIGTQTLETGRLLLRRFTIDDAADMFANWANDSEVTKYLIWLPHRNISVTKEYLNMLIENYSKPSSYDWAIELKETGKAIGSIGVVDLKEEIESAHIGYCIGRQWWNRGFTSEAFSAVIKFLMEEVSVNRIESRHDINNPNSGKVMLKCGLKYEGTLRSSDINNQGICDAVYYGLLRREYFNQ